jgi:hypothetical protein
MTRQTTSARVRPARVLRRVLGYPARVAMDKIATRIANATAAREAFQHEASINAIAHALNTTVAHVSDVARALADAQTAAITSASVDKGTQMLLSLNYKELLARGAVLPSFDDVEFKAYSQTGEDGLLLYVFALIGTTNKVCVEICAGDGIECNCANLLINHGWTGLLFDGSRENVERGRIFYSTLRHVMVWPPKFVDTWISAESINGLIAGNGVSGEIDLLSIDIDGVDYWLWKAIDVVRPRVVIVEYENSWGPDRAMSRPNRTDYVGVGKEGKLPLAGASLAAFVKLARGKGYRLVGCNRLCFNAIFVRDDLGVDALPEVSPTRCFTHPMAQTSIAMHQPTEWTDQEWVEV